MIEILKGPDRVRRRPAVIFGGTDIDACFYTLRLIMQNAVDEALLGNGQQITLTKHADCSYQVDGQGYVIDPALWEEYFCQLYPDSVCARSQLLCQKLGADSFRRYLMELAVVQCVSDYMDVRICREGIRHIFRFEKGYPIREKFRTEEAPDVPDSTSIRFRPDPEIFTDTFLPVHRLQQLGMRTAAAVPGLSVTVHAHQLPFPTAHDSWCFPRGVQDLTAHCLQQAGTPDIPVGYVQWSGTLRANVPADHPHGKPYEARAEASFAFCPYPSVHIHNYFPLEQGLKYTNAPVGCTSFAQLVCYRALKRCCRRWYPGRQWDLLQGIRHIQICLNTFTATGTFFASAYDATIRNPELEAVLLPLLTDALTDYLVQHREQTEAVLSQL